MQTGTMLSLLQDPMGVPFYPAVFQALMVLTFALHILFVNLSVGTTALAVFGRLKGGERWTALSRGMGKSAAACVSTAILLGVAPLLFVQVIYDPFWYASNTLSAAWVIAFVFVMMAGYGSTYVFTMRSEADRLGLAAGVFSLAMFLTAGFTMHALNFQMLQPEKWLGWYTQAGAAVTSGLVLHDFSLPRFLHFIVPAFAATGVYLMLYARYFEVRPDLDKEHLSWVGRLGGGLAFWTTGVQTLAGLGWLLSLPPEFRFYAHPVFMLAAVLGASLLFFLYEARRSPGGPQRLAWPAAGGLLATVLAMAAAREALRGLYVGRSGFTAMSHRVNLDLASTALFFVTFALGLVVLAWLLSVAYQAGRTAGRWEAGPRMRRWGWASVGLLAAWLAVVAGLGVVVTLKNAGS
ncbi:MAG: hypothetical protein HY928_09925 [Elusimicrobia bacterium]|nr:hypothetical protein [Elusimicrobiota bacterium]